MTSSTLYKIESSTLKGIALGYYLHGKSFRVLAGSAIRYPATVGFQTGNGTYENLYRDLLSVGIIQPNENENGAVLTQDHIFSSYAGAASVVLGCPNDGKAWEPLNVES